MEISLKQIANWDSPSLAGMLNNWQELESKFVFLIYAELQRRKYEFTENELLKINEILRFHNTTDLRPFIDIYLKSIGYNDYDEYYSKVISIQNFIIPENVKTNVEIEKSKYPALRTIASIYKVLSIIIIVLTIISALYSLSISKFDNPIILLSIIIVGALMSLGLYALAESIMVFVDIEYNTRKK
jgi:hypothetical protein